MTQKVVRTAILNSIGLKLLRGATLDVMCSKSDRDNDNNGRRLSTNLYVYTIFGSKEVVQRVIVSTGALDEDDKGVSFASKLAFELQKSDVDELRYAQVESIGKVSISESEPTIFVFEDEGHSQMPNSHVDEIEMQDENNKSGDKINTGAVDNVNHPSVCCYSLTATCLACKEGVTVFEYCADNPQIAGCDNQDSPKKQQKGHKHHSWVPFVGGVCGIMALFIVLVLAGIYVTKKRKKHRQNIHVGSFVGDPELVMPATVVLPQDMGKKVAERRPVWATTLLETSDGFAVVQHE